MNQRTKEGNSEKLTLGDAAWGLGDQRWAGRMFPAWGSFLYHEVNGIFQRKLQGWKETDTAMERLHVFPHSRNSPQPHPHPRQGVGLLQDAGSHLWREKGEGSYKISFKAKTNRNLLLSARQRGLKTGLLLVKRPLIKPEWQEQAASCKDPHQRLAYTPPAQRWQHRLGRRGTRSSKMWARALPHLPPRALRHGAQREPALRAPSPAKEACRWSSGEWGQEAGDTKWTTWSWNSWGQIKNLLLLKVNSKLEDRKRGKEAQWAECVNGILGKTSIRKQILHQMYDTVKNIKKKICWNESLCDDNTPKEKGSFCN